MKCPKCGVDHAARRRDRIAEIARDAWRVYQREHLLVNGGEA